MGTITLTGPGLLPLEFEGELLAQAQGRPVRGRWHEVAVYRTQDRRYLLAIRFCAEPSVQRKHREAPQLWTWRFDYLTQAINQVMAWNPLEGVRGFPPLPLYQSRHANLHHRLGLEWDELCASLFQRLGAKETIP